MKHLFVIVFLTFLSSQSHANIYAEPSLGFGFGSYEATVPQDNNFIRDGGMSGLALGLRGGYNYQNFFGGLDLNYSFPSFSIDTATVNSIDVAQNVEDFSGTNFKFGIVAGYKFDFGLRAWAGFNFIDNLSAEDSNYETGGLKHNYNTVAEGTSFKVGAGYQAYDKISLNIEYISSSYSDILHDGAPENPSLYLEDNAEWTASSILLSVSYLYDFDYSF